MTSCNATNETMKSRSEKHSMYEIDLLAAFRNHLSVDKLAWRVQEQLNYCLSRQSSYISKFLCEAPPSSFLSLYILSDIFYNNNNDVTIRCPARTPETPYGRTGLKGTPGVKSNFINSFSFYGPMFIGEVTLYVLTSLIVGIRVYTKLRIIQKMVFNDCKFSTTTGM